MRQFAEKDVTEMKSLHNPPQLVKQTMTAVCLLIGLSEAEAKDWKCVRRVLAARGGDSLKARCDALHVDQVALETALKAKQYLADVTMEQIAKALDVTEYVIQHGGSEPQAGAAKPN